MTPLEQQVWAATYGAAFASCEYPEYAKNMADKAVAALRAASLPRKPRGKGGGRKGRK